MCLFSLVGSYSFMACKDWSEKIFHSRRLFFTTILYGKDAAIVEKYTYSYKPDYITQQNTHSGLICTFFIGVWNVYQTYWHKLYIFFNVLM